jgi:hypothetical protein
MEFCPVCVLRGALGGGVQSGGPFAPEDNVEPTTPEQTAQRFEHYELLMGEDGRPVELGRGAMGVTYKAFDVDLQCPVTLRLRTNFLMPLFTGLAIQTHALEQLGRGAKGWLGWLRNGEPY